MAFFTGLYDSRCQPYVVTLRCNVDPAFSLQSALHGAERRSCAWQRGKNRLSIIAPCRYPLRHVCHGKSTVVKGVDGDYRADAVYVGCHRDIPGRLVGSSIENGTTVIQFDLRKHDFQQEL